jgi:ribonuclease VapC
VIADSSALVAIANDEPGSDRYLEALTHAASRSISTATLLESSIVVDAHADPMVSQEFDALITRLRFTIIPVSLQQARIARQAYRRYGKGSGHAARLNFGDCFAYALAKDFDEPLLFVGNDFVHTDVRSALP